MSRVSVVQVLVVGAVGFAVGFVSGGFGPRGEVRRLEEERFELEKRAASRGGEARRELARMVTGGFVDRGAGGGQPPPFEPRTGPSGAAGSEAAEPGTPVDTDPAPAEDTPEVMREALATRGRLARAALVEGVEPTPEQQVALDAAWSDMNDELDGLARRAVDAFESGEPSRRELMQLGGEVLEVLVSAEDRVLNTLTPEQRAAVDEEITDPTAFVDPRIVDAIVGLRERP
jgi:hypothetical protein